MIRWLSVLFVLLASAEAFCSTKAYEIVSYKVEVKPDIVSKTVSGSTTLRLRLRSAASVLTLPLNGLIAENVKIGQYEADFRVVDDALIVPVSSEQQTSELSITISYRGRPTRGLIFGPNYVYTAYFTCNWMICDADPAIKTTIAIDVLVPKGYAVVASGEEVARRQENGNIIRHAWRQDFPYSSYLFGFAAGKFNEASVTHGMNWLRLLGVSDDASSLFRKFSDTANMMKFFEKVSGVAFPNRVYTQVLVPGHEAQEVSSFSVLGKEVVDPILKDPKNDWGIAHELAHQWWGNLLTCSTWKDFWLNEGITVFMVAAYKEQRWGRAAYIAELDLARRRYQVAVDNRFDVPLTFDGAYPSVQIKRAIVYSKGALFVEALRNELGDEVFWSGLRAYTQENVGKSVDSRIFQLSMERVARKSLSGLFNHWVY
ncbi:MAG TPA: M1 family aminopeptidase [Bdellovibrionota bacterium]|nr:M1 family aminopeptidase [Bdellovibrionota bacterium]